MPLVINPLLIARILAGIAAGLVVAGISTRFWRIISGSERFPRIVRLFNLNEESTLPAWFSSSLLLLAALILGVIATHRPRANNRFGRHWLGLAILFVILSADEAAWMHELTMDPPRDWLGASGIFYLTWVIPAATFVAVLGLIYWPFLAHLSSTTRRLFLLAAVIVVGGALGLELV